MKLLITLSLSLSLLSNVAFGQTCPQAVTALEKGAQAPCKGYLFSPEKEREVYLLNENQKLLLQELDLKDKYIDSYKKSVGGFNEVLDKERQKSELWRKEAEESTTKLVDIQQRTWQRDLLMLGLGALTVIGAGYAISKVANHNN